MNQTAVKLWVFALAWLPTSACLALLDVDNVRQCKTSEECTFEAGQGSCVEGTCIPLEAGAGDSDDPESGKSEDSASGEDASGSTASGFTSFPSASSGEDSSTTSDEDGADGTTGGGSAFCPGTTPKATDPSLLIDDLERRGGAVAADADLPEIEGRRGSWYIANDGTGLQVPSPFEPTPEGAVGTFHSARSTAQGFETWGAAFGVPLNGSGFLNCPYDGSAFDGVRFWARGHGAWQFQVATLDTQPVAFGGRCEGVCNDTFSLALNVEDTWSLFEVPWVALAQAGWGDPAEFNAAELMLLQWSIGASATDDIFVLYIDEVGFIGAEDGGSETGSESSSATDPS